MFKKLLLSFLIATTLFIGSMSSVNAPSIKAEWYDQDFTDWYSKVYGSLPFENMDEKKTAAQVQWIIYTLKSQVLNGLVGKDTVLCFMNQKVDACVRLAASLVTHDTMSEARYAKEQRPSLLSAVFAERSFSGIGYLKEKVTNLHIVPEAKAQEGFGFGALSPLRMLWRGARDISYIMFVIITLAFAFVIMFRVKLFSPQAVVTIQSAIPRIVLAIILVTFSYPIAGFLIDLMYVLTGILAIFFKIGGLTNSTTAAYQFMTGDIQLGLGCPDSMFCIHAGGVFQYLMTYIVLFAISLFTSLFVLNLTTAIFSPLIVIIAIVILFIMLLIASSRITWMLFKAVVQIYVLTIVAPLQIVFGAIINQGGFVSWLKNLTANLAVFPLTGAAFFLSFNFLGWAIMIAIHTGINDIPLVGPTLISLLSQISKIVELTLGIDLIDPALLADAWSPPLIGVAGNGAALIFCIMSLMILLAIPKFADMIKSVIAGRPFAFGTAIGEAFGPVSVLGVAGVQAGSTLEQQVYEAYQRQLAATPPAARSRAHEILHTVASAIRAASGGRIK